jgi:SAM-dependent methyltransferase
MDLHEYTVAGLHDYMQAYVESLPRTISVLDLGCGSGAWLMRLKRLGFSNLTGVDISPPAFDGIRWVSADLNREILSLGRFGLVTSFEVLEHLESPGNLLANIASHLDGFALVTTPNIHSLHSRVKFAITGNLPSFDGKGEPTHVTPILLPAFEKVAARYGLAVQAWTYPENGTVLFGRLVRSIAAVARLVAPDELPGDSLCMRLSRLAVA